MPTQATQSPHRTHGPISLWAGIVIAPAIWGMQQVAMYSLSPYVCTRGKSIPLHIVTLVCVIGALVACYLCWRDWSALGTKSPEEKQGDPDQRTRFIAAVGLFMSAFSLLVILAQGSVSFFFDPCWS